jgi:NAD(P)-dependent dehydrogenase (short-subunit alcohol dehydrogenase family)
VATFNLSGKVIMITGAGKGIGREAAFELAALGAFVVVTDIDQALVEETEGLVVEKGGKALSLKHDVTSPEDWAQVIATIKSTQGRLDVLVNNAGIMINKPFAMTTLADFRRVMNINVDSIFMGCQAALELMKESGKTTEGASIINLSSIYGQVGGPMQSAYCASKGAVRMLTKALAVELARFGTKIRVNSVHPGPVNTELGRSGITDAVAFGVLPNEEAGIAKVTTQFPMGRWGEIHDIAPVIAFLASDASKFMTGTELTIDGGYTAI